MFALRLWRNHLHISRGGNHEDAEDVRDKPLDKVERKLSGRVYERVGSGSHGEQQLWWNRDNDRFLRVSLHGQRVSHAEVQGNREDPTTWLALVIAAGLVGTAAGWWLRIRYLRRGSAALAQGAGIARRAACAGRATALGGTWFALRGNSWIFAAGLPALLPFAHL